jgi:hypothetical protein
MEKYIGPGIKINLEKGIEFYHVASDSTLEIFQIYRDNGTVGGKVSLGVTLDESSWIDESGLVVNLSSKRIHISNNSNIKGTVLLDAMEVYLDMVIVEIKSEIISSDTQFGRIKIKDLVLSIESKIELVADIENYRAHRFEIDMENVNVEKNSILKLRNYGSVRDLRLVGSSALVVDTVKFSINNVTIGQAIFINISELNTLFISDLTVRSNPNMNLNHMSFNSTNATIKENNLIIANVLIKGEAYVRKNIEDEYVIYENETWEK